MLKSEICSKDLNLSSRISQQKDFKSWLIWIHNVLHGCATLNNDRYHYLGNSGINVNVNGQKKLTMCTEKNLVSDNWLILDDKQFISEFTYLRVTMRSQDYWFLTNAVDSVNSLRLLPTMITFNHYSCSIFVR